MKGLNSKRGQGLSTNAMVLIVLGVIVLVVLILGFTIGWNRFLPFIQSNNIDNIQTACSLACSTGNTFDYCEVQREVNDGTNPDFVRTCYDLANEQTYIERNYGIEKCPAINCE